MGLGKTYSTKYLLDSNNYSGDAGQVLISTATGINWSDGTDIIGGPYVTIGTTQTITGEKTFSLTSTFNNLVKLATTNATSFTQINADAGGLYIETAGSTDALSDMRFQSRASGAGNYVQMFIKPSNQSFLFKTNGAAALTLDSSQDAIFTGNISGVRGFFNSGTTNVVATFTSTDGTAGIGLIDSTGNVELSASGDVFQVQPAGGTAQLTVSDSITKVSGMLNIIGSRATYVDNAEDDTATAHIFTTDALAGDFDQLAGSLVLQARVNDAIYRDIILAGGLGTVADPVVPILTVKGEGVVNLDGMFYVTEREIIGVGTLGTQSDALLTLNAPDAFAGLDIASQRTSGNIGGLRFRNSTATQVGSYLVTTTGIHNWYAAQAASINMTLSAAGNLGINVTSPSDAKLQVLGNVIFDSHSLSDPDATSRTAYPAAQMLTHYDEANGVSIIGGEGGFAGTGLTIGEETGRSSDFKFIRGVSDTNGGAGAAEEFWVDGLGNSYFAGLMGIGGAPAARKLEVSGITKSIGYMNTNNYFERLLGSITFANGVANQNVDIVFGNISFWGYIELEITGTYSNQNTSGKYTKAYAVGTNVATSSAAGIIYTNESRVVDNLGFIKNNVAFGDFRFDGTDDTGTFAIKLSHIVSTGNNYTVKVRVFTHGSNGANGASGVMNNIGYTAVYTETALTREYVYYNDNVGIGTTNPSGAKLAVMGGSVGIGTTSPNNLLSLRKDVADGDVAIYLQNYNSVIGSTDETVSIKFAHGNDAGTGYVGAAIVGGKEGDFESNPSNVKGFMSFQTNFGSVSNVLNERMRISAAGAIRFNAYGAGTLVTDASGNITVSSGGGAGGPYLKDTTDTFTGALTIVGDIRGSGQQLILNAGEAYSYATGQTGEALYVNAESGLQVNSSPDNWGTGWAGRDTATICGAGGNSSFPGSVTTFGDLAVYNDSFIFSGDAPFMRIVNSAETDAGIIFEDLQDSNQRQTIAFNSSDNSLKFMRNNANTENMRITSGGMVGIGLTNPSGTGVKLNVSNAGLGGTANGVGLVRIGGFNNYASLELGIEGNYSGMIRSYGNDLKYYAGHWRTIGNVSSEDHSHYWYTSKASSANWSTPKMELNEDGNLGIGLSNSPSYPLDVTGTIRATGDVIAYSDARVKDNVVTIENALDKVTKLRGVSYTRNDVEDKTTKIGVIAQEVLEVLPEVVQQDDEGKYSVAYGNMVGLLIESIKELKAEVDLLKSKPCTCNKCNCNI